MGYASTVTRSGQITLPKDIREALGVEPGQRVIFRRKKDTVEIERAKSVEEISAEIRALIPEDIRQEYIRKYGGMTASEVREAWLKTDEAKEYFEEELRRSL